MAEGKIHRLFQDSLFQNPDHVKNINQDSSSLSSMADSVFSDGSESTSSCSDTIDDASSLNSSHGSYDLSELMAQLPIKKGLSRFYEGKSESFATLSNVQSIEDLAKKTTPPRSRKLKASKSCGTGLNLYKPYTLSKPVISKKSTVASPRFIGTRRAA